jgi:hypothetical protein
MIPHLLRYTLLRGLNNPDAEGVMPKALCRSGSPLVKNLSKKKLNIRVFNQIIRLCQFKRLISLSLLTKLKAR